MLRRVQGLLSKSTVNREQDLKRWHPFWLSLLIIGRYHKQRVLLLSVAHGMNKSFSGKVEKPPKDSNEENRGEQKGAGWGFMSDLIKPWAVEAGRAREGKDVKTVMGLKSSQNFSDNPAVGSTHSSSSLRIPRMSAESQGQPPSVFRPWPLLLAVPA